MNKYEVGFYLDISGKCIVEANSCREAEHIMREYISENGIDELDFKTMNRDFGAVNCEELKNFSGNANIAKEDFSPVFVPFEEDNG